jgi:hypothetical protein
MNLETIGENASFVQISVDACRDRMRKFGKFHLALKIKYYNKNFKFSGNNFFIRKLLAPGTNFTLVMSFSILVISICV